MPFTFSHPAIILPLRYLPSRYISLTGLVIGSLTPDFEYFIRMKIQSNYSHTISGIFWFDLPLGIILPFIFHNIIRNTLYDNLPLFLQQRVLKFKMFNWNIYFKAHWFVVLYCIVIGACSHLLWDSFTHDTGFFVKNIPLLSQSVIVYSKSIPVLKILQHSSTIFGGLILLYFILKIPKDKRVYSVSKNSIVYWITITIITSTIVGIRFFYGLEYKQYGNVIVLFITAFMVALVFAPILKRLKYYL